MEYFQWRNFTVALVENTTDSKIQGAMMSRKVISAQNIAILQNS